MDGSLPLRHLTGIDSVEVIKALLEAGADVHETDAKKGAIRPYPLHLAVQNGDVQVTKALL